MEEGLEEVLWVRLLINIYYIDLYFIGENLVLWLCLIVRKVGECVVIWVLCLIIKKERDDIMVNSSFVIG